MFVQLFPRCETARVQRGRDNHISFSSHGILVLFKFELAEPFPRNRYLNRRLVGIRPPPDSINESIDRKSSTLLIHSALCFKERALISEGLLISAGRQPVAALHPFPVIYSTLWDLVQR